MLAALPDGGMTKLAQAQVKSAPNHPAYALSIGGRPFTGELQEATVTYEADGGASQMTLITGDPLESYQNAAVRLSLGYGRHLKEYFAGELDEPEDDHWGAGSKANANGPFKRWAEQYLLSQVSYNGFDVESAFLDLDRRAGSPAGTLEVRGGRSFVFADAIFPLEASLASAGDSLAETSNFVFCDRPGRKRLVMPRPRPGATGRAKAAYDESHYPEGGFKAVGSRKGYYALVVAFRRDEKGTLVVDARVPVDVRGPYRPPPNRAYLIPDFKGDQTAADREVYATAGMLTNGAYRWSLTEISANPDLLLYDTIEVSATEFGARGGGGVRSRWLRTYSCMIDGTVEAKIAPDAQTMNLSGETALRIREKALPKPFFFPSREQSRTVALSSRGSATGATFTSWDQENILIDEIDTTFAELS